MHDLPPDLPRLRTLRAWHAMWVERLDRAIADGEVREAAEAQPVQAPAVPDWILAPDRTTPVLHRGGCDKPATTGEEIDRRAALEALHRGITACPWCRPDTELGVLD